jgi:hypothetical protein
MMHAHLFDHIEMPTAALTSVSEPKLAMPVTALLHQERVTLHVAG